MTIRATDVTLTGTLTDPQGNVVNGTLTFVLAGFGATVPLIAGIQALPGLTFTATVTSGVFSTSFYSNQIITPGPLVTFYNISFQPSITTTTILAFSENFQFSPGTFDLSQLVPLTGTIPNKASSTQATPNVFTSQSGQFLTGLTASGNFTTGPTTLTLVQANGVYGWSSINTSPLANADTGTSRLSAGSIAIGNGTQGDFSGTIQLSAINQQTANSAQWIKGQNNELLTLSTSGTTTDTVGNLLPSNSIIESVVARVTTTITVATDWKLGDSSQAARFTAAQSGAQLTAGATVIGLNQADPTVASANLGPVQTSAAKVRVTTTGTPGAGAIRITVFYRQFVAPTS